MVLIFLDFLINRQLLKRGKRNTEIFLRNSLFLFCGYFFAEKREFPKKRFCGIPLSISFFILLNFFAEKRNLPKKKFKNSAFNFRVFISRKLFGRKAEILYFVKF